MPGTGKTTVARRVGMLFKSLDLLASADVVECSASDFVTGYANQSSGKTRKVRQPLQSLPEHAALSQALLIMTSSVLYALLYINIKSIESAVCGR